MSQESRKQEVENIAKYFITLYRYSVYFRYEENKKRKIGCE